MPSKLRRKVVKCSSSYRKTFRLELDCGHIVYRRDKGGSPPKTTECEHCAKFDGRKPGDDDGK